MSLPNLLPELSEEEYANLKDSIQVHGFWPENPVIVDELGNVLDGHNRKRAAIELGIEPVYQVKRGLTDWEKIEYAVKSNTNRRQLTIDQRRELLRRLIEVHDEIIRQETEVARLAGNAAGGKSSLTETQLRSAAAEATKTAFNGPVTVTPRQKVDRLEKYGKMIGVSRATVARDEAHLERIAAIEEAAEKLPEEDQETVRVLLNAPHPNLSLLEQEVGLRASVTPQAPPPARFTEDREAALDMLAMGLAAIHYTPFTADDARAVLEKSGVPINLLTVDLLNVMRAMRDVEKGL